METIKQKKVTVKRAEGGDIVVRRMRWKAARSLLKKISTALGSFKKSDELQKDLATMMNRSDQEDDAFLAAAGNVMLTAFPSLADSLDELLMDLALASTDMSEGDFDELDTLTASEVITAAISINFDAELKNSWSGLAKTFGALTGNRLTK